MLNNQKLTANRETVIKTAAMVAVAVFITVSYLYLTV